MSVSMRGNSRQGELFGRAMNPAIELEASHRLVQLTNHVDWTELEAVVERIRRRKLKNRAGRPPRLRALIGAVMLRATRRMSYRDAEDQIRHYAPARYLCGLTESTWTPDFTTIEDFTQLLGEEGLRAINQYAVMLAVDEKLADPKAIAADTTAQEAVIGHPNEIGLMASFLTSIVAASKKVGGRAHDLWKSLSSTWKAAKKKVREYRLFAKTKEAKSEIIEAMAKVVERVQVQVGHALRDVSTQKDRLTGYSKLGWKKLLRLQGTMTKLLPQIRYWLRTGRVAVGKIINMHIPELYSIVRGKIGKKVEFGLRWGITRLRGGFLLARVARDRLDLQDIDYAIGAVDDQIALFGKAPRSVAYDRAGYSAENVAKLKAKKVRDIALAPRGKARWRVCGRVKEKLVKERAQVEGGIGALKSPRYGFHRPAARSSEMMGAYGQQSVLGLNLNKLVREICKRDKLALVG